MVRTPQNVASGGPTPTAPRPRGPRAPRWEEYLLLLAAAATLAAYGALHDQVTVTISRDYFLFDKGAYRTLRTTAPAESALRWEAARIGALGTWWTGALIGLALLGANHPRWRLPQLSNLRLYRLVVLPLGCAAVIGAAMGAAAYLGLPGPPAHLPPSWRCVWGAHLGGYVGGALGTLLAVWRVLRLRRRLAARSSPPTPKRPPADHR
jgi:hypothetical protein